MLINSNLNQGNGTPPPGGYNEGIDNYDMEGGDQFED